MLSVLPFFGHFLAAILFGQVVDRVRAEHLASTTTARKVLVYVGGLKLASTRKWLVGPMGISMRPFVEREKQKAKAFECQQRPKEVCIPFASPPKKVLEICYIRHY